MLNDKIEDDRACSQVAQYTKYELQLANAYNLRKSIINTYNIIIIICRVHYETYILYYIVRAAECRFYKRFENNWIRYRSQRWKSFEFFSLIFPAAWLRGGRDGGKKLSAYLTHTHTHTNYFIHAYIVYTNERDSRRIEFLRTLGACAFKYYTAAIDAYLYNIHIIYIIIIRIPTRNAHIPMR